MISIQNKNDCCGCTACLASCPVSCISMEADQEGFEYPFVEQEKCVRCEKCLKVCPVLNQVKNPDEPVVYACYNKNEEIRLKSSSGGIFSLLAEHVLNQQGVVFGAKFNENFEVVHDFTDTIEGLAEFRGSKYVQSRVGHCFQQVKRFLDDGREVLFSGTPCQVAGLKKLLGKDYSNLLLVDLICKGVPSPKVFHLYKNELEQKFRQKITRYFFRTKSSGWKNSRIVVNLGKDEYQAAFHRNSEDHHMKMFLLSFSIRPSCFFCPANDFRSGSDMTIGDYWGIQQAHPELDDDMGTSVVLVHTQKGRECWSEIQGMMNLTPSSFELAFVHNPSLRFSMELPPRRDGFFKELGIVSLRRLVKKYTKKQKPLISRVRSMASRLLGKRVTALLKKFLVK